MKPGVDYSVVCARSGLVPLGGESSASASSAAMQPMPAAVTAWRKTSSLTSPAAKTPGIEVAVESGARHADSPTCFISSWPLNSSVAGAWPMAMKTPSAARSVIAPVLTFFELHAGDRLRVRGADDLVDRVIPDHLDLRVLEQAVLQDLLGAEVVAAVHDGHLAWRSWSGTSPPRPRCCRRRRP